MEEEVFLLPSLASELMGDFSYLDHGYRLLRARFIQHGGFRKREVALGFH